MNSVVITGADGFIGSHTTQYFLSKGMSVTALGRRDTPIRLKKHEKLRYCKCDINQPDEIERILYDGSYDVFIHFAWEGSSGDQRTDYALQMKNAMNAVEIMKAAKKTGCRRFLCAGTIMEYEVESVVHAQGTRPGMAYIYGMGKHMAHCLCKSIAAEIGIDLIWPMITNAYGVGEYSPRMLNTTMRKIINGEPLQFTAATQNYDFIYVSDVARAIYLIAEKGKAFSEYMIGSGSARPLKDFLTELRNELAPGRELLFGDIPFTGVNMPLSVFSIDTVRNDCGFEPEVSFADGIRRTMEWLRGWDEKDTNYIQ